jgi:hypothetical protein
MCAAPKDVVEEMTVQASAEQIGNLVNAMGVVMYLSLR